MDKKDKRLEEDLICLRYTKEYGRLFSLLSYEETQGFFNVVKNIPNWEESSIQVKLQDLQVYIKGIEKNINDKEASMEEEKKEISLVEKKGWFGNLMSKLKNIFVKKERTNVNNKQKIKRSHRVNPDELPEEYNHLLSQEDVGVVEKSKGEFSSLVMELQSEINGNRVADDSENKGKRNTVGKKQNIKRSYRVNQDSLPDEYKTIIPENPSVEAETVINELQSILRGNESADILNDGESKPESVDSQDKNAFRRDLVESGKKQTVDVSSRNNVPLGKPEEWQSVEGKTGSELDRP